MPYKIRKQKCTRSDGKKGNYVLKYKPKKPTKKKKDSEGMVKAGCHTSKKNANAQRAAIEGGPREADEASYDEELREQDPGNKFSGKDYASNPTGTTTVTYGESLIREWIREKLLITEVGNLSAPEMQKRQRRFDTFLKKIKEKSKFKTVTGDEFEIPEEGNDKLIQALMAKDPDEYKSAFLTIVTVPPKAVSSPTKIMKTAEFGGLVPGARLQKEDIQISQIQRELTEKGPLDINVGERTAIGVVSVESVTGTPKADCVLKDRDGNVVASISLKDADIPTQMQQWGGITKFKKHPEVKSFIEDLKKISSNAPDGRIQTAYYRPLKDQKLAQDLCYGDKSSQLNDCDLIIASQKPIEIDKSGNFVATNIFYSPSIPTEGWAPALWATYRKGRGGNLGLENIRVGCYPIEWGFNRSHELLEISVSESIIRTLIKEELNGSDKTEINRMIKKAIDKDRKQQRKLMQAEIASEIKNAKITKVIKELAAEELKKEMSKEHKGKEFQGAVTEITKKVIKKLYRELSFSYNPVIDRIKL